MIERDRSSLRDRRICFVNTNRAWGGGEKWAHDFAVRALQHGARVSAIVHTESVLGDRLARLDGLTLGRVPIGNLSFLDPFVGRRLIRFFREHAIEIVVMALPSDLKCAGLAARRAGVPHIVYRRGIDVPVRATLLNRHLYGRVLTRLICNSEQTRRSVLAHDARLIDPDRVSVLYNGFDVEAFDRARRDPLVERDPHALVIGTAGRLTAQKGQTHLLHAVRLLRERGLPVQLLVAGTGELHEALADQARALGITDAVRMLGFVEEMRRFYASLDVFVLPSLWEGFGYALVEAMAASVPVVAFDVSSNPEILDDGAAGRLARVGDATDLAEHIETLARNEALRSRLAEAGRSRVLEVFHLDRCFEQFARLFGERAADLPHDSRI